MSDIVSRSRDCAWSSATNNTGCGGVNVSRLISPRTANYDADKTLTTVITPLGSMLDFSLSLRLTTIQICSLSSDDVVKEIWPVSWCELQ